MSMPGPNLMTVQRWRENSLELQQRGIYKTSISWIIFKWSRKWKIKVGQIPCDSVTNPRFGCLQYHTGTTGTVNVPEYFELPRRLFCKNTQVRSFNFLADSGSYLHLANQFYKVCLRREEKYCAIAWSQCSDTDSFKVGKLEKSFKYKTKIYLNTKYNHQKVFDKNKFRLKHKQLAVNNSTSQLYKDLRRAQSQSRGIKHISCLLAL